jgi:hypothetical protein
MLLPRPALAGRTGPGTPSGCDGFRGELFHAAASPVLAVEHDRTGIGIDQPHHAARERRLARTGSPTMPSVAPRGRLSETFFTAGITRAPRPRKPPLRKVFETSVIVRTTEGERESFSNRAAKRKILPENNVLTACSVCSFLRARQKRPGVSGIEVKSAYSQRLPVKAPDEVSETLKKQGSAAPEAQKPAKIGRISATRLANSCAECRKRCFLGGFRHIVAGARIKWSNHGHPNV